MASADREIIYSYVKGKGWLAGYEQPFDQVRFDEIQQAMIDEIWLHIGVNPRALTYYDAI